MSIYKRCKVIMLPTNDKSILFIGKISGQLHDLAIADKDSSTYNQNLYILSDEKIKENDWCYKADVLGYDTFVNHKLADSHITHGIFQWKNTLNLWYKDAKKIIATTDSSLTFLFNNPEKMSNRIYKPLPSPSKSFIEKYIVEHNKGNIITEVLVEYNTSDENMDGYVPMFGGKEIGDIIKINQKENTITIKKIKDSYSRDEVIILCRGAFITAAMTESDRKNNPSLYKGETTITLFDDWVKENL